MIDVFNLILKDVTKMTLNVPGYKINQLHEETNYDPLYTRRVSATNENRANALLKPQRTFLQIRYIPDVQKQ
jgi:hypothetical protein